MSAYPTTFRITNQKKAFLVEEITDAIRNTPISELKDWGLRIPTTMSMVTVRRGKNIGNLVKFLGNAVIDESQGFIDSIRIGQVIEHISQRGKVARDSLLQTCDTATNAFLRLSTAINNEPSVYVPKLAAGVLGFLGASGGLDGDGGVPDLDFLGGIGAHRSIFTHSIIAGIVIETILISFSDLTKTVYRNLPEHHDQLWDRLVVGNGEIMMALSQGISAGIAYHLGVDATIDGDGLYRDLPVSMPQGAHDFIISTNAVTEGVDSMRRDKRSGQGFQRTFSTFKEASAFAKQHPGSKLTRSKTGTGFVVI